jgi:hypothetical protein
MTRERYTSIPERITWTNGFRCATDKLVLGALSTFANFETGRGARMSVPSLTSRAQLPRRTVERGLQRLEADHWITARRRHRHATSWDINVDRLAATWLGTDKNLTATSGGQRWQTDKNLTATSGGQPPDLTATYGGQEADLTATSGGPIPCTYGGSPVERTPVNAPALRAGPVENPADEDPADKKRQPAKEVSAELPPWEAFNRARQAATRNTDVQADREDHPDSPASRPGGRLRDDRPTHSPGLPLRQGPDQASPEGPPRPGTAVRPPTQANLGPLDLTPTAEQHRRFMEELRARVGLRQAGDVDEDQEQTG